MKESTKILTRLFIKMSVHQRPERLKEQKGGVSDGLRFIGKRIPDCSTEEK